MLFARTQFTLSQTIFLIIENSLSPNFIYICFIVLFYPLISTVGGSTELAALVFVLHGEQWTASHDILHPSIVTPMVSRAGKYSSVYVHLSFFKHPKFYIHIMHF